MHITFSSGEINFYMYKYIYERVVQLVCTAVFNNVNLLNSDLNRLIINYMIKSFGLAKFIVF